MADLSGDGSADILGCRDGGVVVSDNIGNWSSTQPALIVENFGVQEGWSEQVHLTMRNPVNLYDD